MKSSIHLFYGIIIGILLVACTGQTTSETTSSTQSIKQGKEEFKEEKVFFVTYDPGADEKIAELKKKGWTIIDVDGHGNSDRNGNHFTIIHAGR
jgi:hypothetical protein